MKSLVLVGSGEFTPAMAKVDTLLLSQLKSKKVAILPTAAGREDTTGTWIQFGINHFKKLGADPVGIPLLNRKDASNKSYINEIANSQIVYFSGGSSGYLRSALIGTPVWKQILDLYSLGKITLVGSSAGAMVMGKYLLTNVQEIYDTGGEPTWEEGFGLVDFTIIPHFDMWTKAKPKLMNKILNQCPQQVKPTLLGIDEDTAVIFKDRKISKVLGKGKITKI